ncbi:lytic polysaccharide monooxygenase [Paenibacillus sp. GCM10027627]|uniref:lytic polysaccharide monooxygenase n=1 Tax=unclassified Paenibacillus TaxID=185978 RepID=UPI00362BDC87
MIQVRLNSTLMMRVMIAGGGLLLLLACMVAFANSASAHGYVDSPGSRAILCKNGVNTNCGNIIYEPQSLEGLKGFPAAGPADGKIASAGLAAFSNLDAQSATRWSKVNISSGQNTFTWKFTARHATTSYRYFITKANWDPNQPLTRAQLELTPFCTVNGNGQQPPATLSHSCNVPARTGYHIVLAVWDIADTPNAWYIAIDLNFTGGPGGDNVAPTAPGTLAASNVGTNSATLNWGASTDNVGVTGYRIFNGANQIGSTTGATTLNLTGLTANTAYSLNVKAIDAAGNLSGASNTVNFTTQNTTGPDTQAPTAPSGLHVMGTSTPTSIPLMWNASTDNVGVTGYQVFRGTTLVQTVSGSTLSYTVTGLTAGTAYTFTIKAIDAAGNVSAASNALTVTTPTNPTTYPAWSATAVYVAGNKVTHNGVNYEAKWWTQGETPGTAAATVWKVIP